jgi:hypothetical protein
MDTKAVIGSLSALAQETRLAIFCMLVEAGTHGLAAGVIAGRLDIPASSLSFHWECSRLQTHLNRLR